MTKNKKIVVVDDSESIREVVGFELERNGYSVIKAADGDEAIKYFDGTHFDLLLTDLHMPNMTGLELIRKIRDLKNYKHLPILFLTTETQQPIIEEAKRSGATGWITKPFNSEKLIRTVKKVIG